MESIRLAAVLRLPAQAWQPERRTEAIKKITDVLSQAGELINLDLQDFDEKNARTCSVCGWIHDSNFTQFRLPEGGAVSLSGVLPDIVRVVHRSHETGFARLSTKDSGLIRTCGGYRQRMRRSEDVPAPLSVEVSERT